jgi:hypothetical protein
MLSVFGFLSLLAALADTVCQLLGVSITGTAWSPVVFFALGVLLCLLEVPQRGGSLR